MELAVFILFDKPYASLTLGTRAGSEMVALMTFKGTEDADKSRYDMFSGQHEMTPYDLVIIHHRPHYNGCGHRSVTKNRSMADASYK